jgi:UDP-N-acetylmuramate dehydrogenase
LQDAWQNIEWPNHAGSHLGRRAVERIEEIEALARATESQCRTWQWLKNFTALGVGGPVAAIVYPSSMIGAATLVHRLGEAGLRWRPLGHGTSILASDDLHDYVAVSLRLLDQRLIFDGTRVRVHGGYSLSALVQATAERGLAGLGPFAGLGGSLGGALRMNLGGEIWCFVEEIVIAERGALKVMLTRGAALKEEQVAAIEQCLILAATLNLEAGNPEELREEIWRRQQARLAARPDIAGAVSRVFRATEPEMAGQVIEQLGFKGEARGGARISETHADFIINEGRATAEDVFALTDLVRERARCERGLELEYDIDVWRDETRGE